MTKIVDRRGFLAVQPDAEYPKYFGYHPNLGGISEPISAITKLSEIKMGRGSAFGTDCLASLGYYKKYFSSAKLLWNEGAALNEKINKLRKNYNYDDRYRNNKTGNQKTY